MRIPDTQITLAWKESVRGCAKGNLLMILTLVGVVLGFTIGFLIRPLKPSGDALMWLAMDISDMMTALEGPLAADRRVTRFTVPFRVTLSANGSATFIACSCLFIINLNGTTPAAGTIATVGVLVTVSALAIPSVPSSSIVTIVIILASLNIPVEAIALLLSVEFLLDRFRTGSNCVSHSMCAVVAWRLGLGPDTLREDPEQGTTRTKAYVITSERL